MSKLVNLNYDNFSTCTARMLQDLMENGEYSDVTLVADDGLSLAALKKIYIKLSRQAGPERGQAQIILELGFT